MNLLERGIVVLSCLFVSASVGCAAAPLYSVVDLGPTGGLSDVDLNNRGQAAFIGSGSHLVRYSDGIGLEMLSDRYFQGTNIGINDRGQIATDVRIPVEPYAVACRYTDGVGVEVLLPGQKSYSAGINNLGHVAVQSGNLYLYTDAAGLALLGRTSLTYDMNDSDVVVGQRENQAFMYRPGTGFQALTGVGGLGQAYGVSNTGYVAGSYYDRGKIRAYRMAPDGTVTHLLGNTIAAWDVNDSGSVVGYSGAYFPNQSAFLYSAFLYTDADGLRNLNALINPSSGWHLQRAQAINQWGQIAGTGYSNGRYRAFRLDPVQSVPEPGSLMLISIGALGLIRLRRRR